MEKYFLVGLLLAIAFGSQAQDSPFKEYGDNSKILTLSDGKYDEIQLNDSLQRVGSVIVNIISKKIVAFVESDTSYSEATLEPEVTSRWYSPDPLAAKFPYLTPYNFVANNPILFVDPDGRVLKVHGANAEQEAQLIEKYKTVISKAFAGKIEAKVAEDGTVSFHKVANTKLDVYEENALVYLNKVVSAKEVVNHTLYDHDTKGSEEILVGSYLNGAIDLDDISAFGNDNNKMTAKGKLVHESTEQLEKEKSKGNGEDVTKVETFEKNHEAATEAENKTSKFKRSKTDSDEGTAPYNKRERTFKVSRTYKEGTKNIKSVEYKLK